MGLFGRNWSDVLQIVGAGLQDASTPGAGNLALVNQQLAGRQKQAQQQALLERFRRPQGPMPDPTQDLLEGAMAGLSPELLLTIHKLRNPDPPKLQIVEGPDGIYSTDGKTTTRIQEYPKEPPKPQAAPAGFRWNAAGDLELIPGYLAGQAQLSGTRRDAIVSRPMPRVGGAGGAGGKAGKPKPWERDY